MTDKKVALVTGGSRGIGKACALELAKAGCDVVINFAGNVEAAEKNVYGWRIYGMQNGKCSVEQTSISYTMKCFMPESIAKKYGQEGLKMYHNNAGITRDDLFIRMGEDKWNAVINTNLSSAFYVSKPVVKLMMKQRSGAIVNMSSVVGLYGNPGQANYSAAKAGLVGFTKSLAKELGSRGIRVNAVAPGFIATDMTKDLGNTEEYMKMIPLKRMGEAVDIAKTVKFLALDADYITGQAIQVDGGLII